MEQHKALCRSFPPYENQIDMTCFPVVAFHNLSCGSSTIMPDADIAKPATMEPERIYQQLKDGAVNCLSAAPAFMSRLVTFMKENRLSLPNLQQLAVGGAPVTMGLQRDIAEVLPDCKAFVVYGSTEAEPIAHHPIAPPFEEVPAFVGGTPVSFIDLKIVVLP
ncbi:MAG: AMP-binding protein, partial [Myxococcota bacterium]|nr:AMP-binding protein [Myxococcota bacterium]